MAAANVNPSAGVYTRLQACVLAPKSNYLVHQIMPMKPLIFCFCVALVYASASAQTNVWQPSPGHTQIPIWPGIVPDARPVPGPEYATNIPTADGKSCLTVFNVSQPTMTVYSPGGRNTGVAMVVFPGGGYQCLAMNLEGTEVCDWLTSRGITAVLLKYRVPVKRVGLYWESPPALEDGQADAESCPISRRGVAH